MELLFYEKIACDMVNITPDELFCRSRNDDFVLARQFCMVLRRTLFKLSLRNTGLRYDRDHATALHAVKGMNNYKYTKHINYKLYQEFLKKCLYKMKEAETIDKDEKVTLRVLDVMDKYEFKKYIKGCEMLFINMFRNILENDNRNDMIELIEKCHEKLHEMQLVYEQLPESKDKVFINP